MALKTKTQRLHNQKKAKLNNNTRVMMIMT